MRSPWRLSGQRIDHHGKTMHSIAGVTPVARLEGSPLDQPVATRLSARPQQNSDLADFFDTLTPGEREFLEEQFGEPEDDPRPPRTANAVWQITWRIRKKLRGFLGMDE